MRPGADVLAGRTRKDLNVTTPTPESHAAPTSFFLATEDMVDRVSANSRDPGCDSTFGVRSLQETICEVGNDGGNGDEEDNDDEDEDRDEREEDHHSETNKSKGPRRRSTLKPKLPSRDSSPESLEQVRQVGYGDSSQPHPHQALVSYPSASHSVASLSQISQAQDSSLPSSPKSTSTRSLRHSDEESMDDGGSQAILSSEDDGMGQLPETQDTAPQLIMPSIKIPSRRPFTERGKDIGRLKILIAGDSGVGKTSLIKSIVQICEDIVHVDPLSSNAGSVDQLHHRKSKGKTSNPNANSTSQIMEVYASTKAYPPWWSEIEESRILRRRKSIGDTVLERNLCFVDTPGYSHKASTESVGSVVQYAESQLTKVFSLANANDGELLTMLSGHGGAQVDVVFYMVLQHLKPVDLEYLRRLSMLTNVIPLVAKADLLSNEEIERAKSSITSDLESAGIKPFVFDPSGPAASSVYTVCSAPSNDEENMDASLLMSPEYTQPLLPSKLAALVHQIFDKNHMQWLKHLAAKRLINSRREMEVSTMIASFPKSPIDPSQSSYLRSPTLLTSSTAGQATLPYASGAASYVQVRVTDHTQREEKLAQVRLAKWAGDLQRSLHHERARYEALSRGERAVWLTERLGECVNEGTLVPVHGSATVVPSDKALSSLKPESPSSSGRILADGGDPLGLLRWNEAMRRRGWIAFQVVGSFGVLGAMAVWMARSWGLGSDEYSGWTWLWWPR